MVTPMEAQTGLKKLTNRRRVITQKTTDYITLAEGA
jgi:hypothetical protein